MKLYELFESVKTIDKEPESGLWFIHQSPKKLTKLKPLSYTELAKTRSSVYPIADRKDEERVYKSLTQNPENMSFLYVTVVGYNKFEKPTSYPGYTYYFKLTPSQIKKCVFTIIDKKEWMKPSLGKAGLESAQLIWNKHNPKFKKHTKKGVGVVYPRIEVVIPFSVTPSMVIPQEEDRD
jgi:hypothetical protein